MPAPREPTPDLRRRAARRAGLGKAAGTDGKRVRPHGGLAGRPSRALLRVPSARRARRAMAAGSWPEPCLPVAKRRDERAGRQAAHRPAVRPVQGMGLHRRAPCTCQCGGLAPSCPAATHWLALRRCGCEPVRAVAPQLAAREYVDDLVAPQPGGPDMRWSSWAPDHRTSAAPRAFAPTWRLGNSFGVRCAWARTLMTSGWRWPPRHGRGPSPLRPPACVDAALRWDDGRLVSTRPGMASRLSEPRLLACAGCAAAGAEKSGGAARSQEGRWRWTPCVPLAQVARTGPSRLGRLGLGQPHRRRHCGEGSAPRGAAAVGRGSPRTRSGLWT